MQSIAFRLPDHDVFLSRASSTFGNCNRLSNLVVITIHSSAVVLTFCFTKCLKCLSYSTTPLFYSCVSPLCFLIEQLFPLPCFFSFIMFLDKLKYHLMKKNSAQMFPTYWSNINQHFNKYWNMLDWLLRDFSKLSQSLFFNKDCKR